MKLYTYTTEGKLSPDAELSKFGNQKTCEINLNLPFDCDIDEFKNRLQGHDYADIMLYSCVSLLPGDSVSSVFPATCVLVVCEDPFRIENHQDSCLEVFVEKNRSGYILMDTSELLDTTSHKFIRNENGKLKLSSESSLIEEETETSDFVVVL